MSYELISLVRQVALQPIIHVYEAPATGVYGGLVVLEDGGIVEGGSLAFELGVLLQLLPFGVEVP